MFSDEQSSIIKAGLLRSLPPIDWSSLDKPTLSECPLFHHNWSLGVAFSSIFYVEIFLLHFLAGQCPFAFLKLSSTCLSSFSYW